MTPDTLDARILAATERRHLARARRWRPRFDQLPITDQWDADARQVLESALYLQRRRAERAGR